MLELPQSEATSRQWPVREDMTFQRRSWFIERLSWLAIAIAILVALAGGLGGSGLLINFTTATANDLRIEYQPIVRSQSQVKLQIDTSSPWIKFEPGFDQFVEIQAIVPPPLTANNQKGLRYSFAPNERNDRRVITIWYRPERFGILDIAMSTDTGQVRMIQLAYP